MSNLVRQFVLLFVGLALLLGCTPETIDKINDPATLQKIDDVVKARQEICASLPLLGKIVPPELLVRPAEMCSRGDDVGKIALALADILNAVGGGYVPESSGGSSGGQPGPVPEPEPEPVPPSLPAAAPGAGQ